eukprot:TRINITY_DN9202_c0_g1_i1.p1 TRINITY_DN9202_c0_g1~~TRINITY_DN9202_c0_g1_i1.p1  ORF type:complete len:236 (+),score=87.32 TRINITY_DN9202_c0_g1_i1:94-801(+)
MSDEDSVDEGSPKIANPSSELKIKLGLVGETGVGKSCLLLRWVENSFFEEDNKYTIGADYKFKKTEVDGQNLKVQVFDTAGQERFRTVTSSFYRGANGIILVFDLADKNSYEEAIPEWLREIKNYTTDATHVILVGNKSDKITDDSQRGVLKHEVEEWAKEQDIPYFELSAKTNEGVEETFNYLLEKIVKHQFSTAANPRSPNGSSRTLNVGSRGKKGKGKKDEKEKGKGGCLIL